MNTLSIVSSPEYLRLLAENETLKEENRLLRAAVRNDAFHAPKEWGLTRTQTCVLGVLVARPIASREALFLALYGDRIDDAPSDDVIYVVVTHLRRKTKPFGVQITNGYGMGWSLDEKSRAALAATSAT